MSHWAHIKIGIVGIILSLSTSACLGDDDDIYDSSNNLSGSYMEMGTLVTYSETSTPSIEGDAYGLSYVTNQSILKSNNIDSIGQRVLMKYILSTNNHSNTNNNEKKYIQIVEIAKVLTKAANTITKNQEDNFGNDFISIENAYISDKHLNIHFTLFINNIPTVHRICLVVDKDVKPNAEGYIPVSLKHDSQGNDSGWESAGWVSFTLNSIPAYEKGKVKGFIISYKSSEGNLQKRIDVETNQ